MCNGLIGNDNNFVLSKIHCLYAMHTPLVLYVKYNRIPLSWIAKDADIGPIYSIYGRTKKKSQHFSYFFFLLFFRSTGIFVFVYAVFYYNKRSNMSGFLQSVQFFGYTLLACYIFFLMLGTVSFFTSLYFVKYIYRYLKMD